jgi:hypothetical protein
MPAGPANDANRVTTQGAGPDSAPTTTARPPTVSRGQATAAADPAAEVPTGHPVSIIGSSSFITNIRAGLDHMLAVSPADYAVVVGSVLEIKEGPRNIAWADSRSIQISANSAAHSTNYAGAIVVHEAVHVRNWFAGDRPVFGCDGEAKSLRAQADYLELAGDPRLATWVRGLIGTWC